MKQHMLIGEPIGQYMLEVQLTEKEVEERQAKFFANHAHINEHQKKLDYAKVVFKDNTAMQITENKKLMDELNDGYIQKEVRAIEYPNWEEGRFEYYAEGVDAGDGIAPIATKTMTAKEKRTYRIAYSKSED